MKKIIAFIFLFNLYNIYAQEVKSIITFSGYAEVYYLYNFNNPISNNQPLFIYSFNRSKEVNLDLGYIKANYSSAKVRANLALMTGTYPHANLSAEPEHYGICLKEILV